MEAGGYRVFVPDLPGFGESPPPPRPWSIDDYVKWVREYCGKNHLPRFFLLGHSFGGRVAIKFAVAHPESILGLILVSAGGAEASETLANLKKKVLRGISPVVKKFSFLPGYSFFRKGFYRLILRKTDYLEARGVMKETFRKVIAESLIPYLPQIKNKTLIIWGRKDRLLPLREGILMKERIPNAEIKILENINHNPQTEAPELLVEKILENLPCIF